MLLWLWFLNYSVWLWHYYCNRVPLNEIFYLLCSSSKSQVVFNVCCFHLVGYTVSGGVDWHSLDCALFGISCKSCLNETAASNYISFRLWSLQMWIEDVLQWEKMLSFGTLSIFTTCLQNPVIIAIKTVKEWWEFFLSEL